MGLLHLVRDEVITRSKASDDDDVKRKTLDDDRNASENDNNGHDNSDEGNMEDDVFYDSDGSDHEEE